jgi:hypothetical protein
LPGARITPQVSCKILSCGEFAYISRGPSPSFGRVAALAEFFEPAPAPCVTHVPI